MVMNEDETLTAGAVFEIQRAWKGIESDSPMVEIKTSRAGMCSYGFQEGKEYLVYAYGDPGELSTSICSRTRMLDNAQSDLAALGPSSVTFQVQGDGTGEKFRFSMWPQESEISTSWHTTIMTQVCPNPDFQEIEGSEFRGLSDLIISHVATNSDGTSTPVVVEYLEGGNDFCNGRAAFPFESDRPGSWTIQANATWISPDGTNHTLLGNEAVVLVKPAIFASSNSKVIREFDPNSNNSLRLFDWSSDGKSILVSYDFSYLGNGTLVSQYAYQQREKDYLGFLDPEDGSVKEIDLPTDFIDIYGARFSPSDDKIILVSGRIGESELQSGMFIFSIAEGRLNRISGLNDDLVWMPDMTNDGRDDFVVGKTTSTTSEGVTDPGTFEMWLTDSSSNPTEKLYSKQLEEREGFQVHDSTSDGKKILMTRSIHLGGPITVYNLTVFDVESRQFETMLPFGSREGVRFNPSGDLIIYDIGYGHRTPGGPLMVTTLDGSYIEKLSTGERSGTYDSPVDYVISPDGSTIIAAVEQWGGGKIYVTRNELAHAMPEFDSLYGVLIVAGILFAYLAMARFPVRGRPGKTNNS